MYMPITIELPNSESITVVIDDRSGFTVITPLYTPPPLPEEKLGYIIGYLLAKRLVEPSIDRVFITYMQRGGILESVYKLIIKGSIVMKAQGNTGIYPYADIRANRATGMEKSVIIKLSKTWIELKGREVIIEMAGAVIPIVGVLMDITKDGIKLKGYDLPVTGIIIGVKE
jgi:hypothetical protein